MADVNAKAAEMFAAGKSVNAVATALFKGAWGTAKKLHDAWKAGDINAAAVDRRKARGGKRAVAAVEEVETEAETDEDGAPLPDVWDLTVNVPREKVPVLFASFTPGEQATAVMTIIQARMNSLLEA